MSMFERLSAIFLEPDQARPEPLPAPAEWYVEMKAQQARAHAFRDKVLAALDERGIPSEVRHYMERELVIAALLLGVKE